MLLSVVLLASAAAAAAADDKKGWSPVEAARRYGMEKATPVKYTPDEIDRFLLRIMEKLEDMPQPDDPKFVFVHDKNKQVHACEIPEDDDDSMEVSANPDDVMETVIRSFADGKCASRRFGEWYYQMCGNLAVKRSPYMITSRKGKHRVSTFKAYESLGVLGRDRRVSSHHSTVTEPRYVEQTYYDGAKCNLEGDPRRLQTTVTFECSRRFVPGYVHINEAVEEHPCKYRLQLQSIDFCDNDWLLGTVEANSFVRCRIYFHPERIHPLMTFLAKFEEEQTARKRRYVKYMAKPLNDAIFRGQLRHPDVHKKMEQWATEFVRRFDKEDAQYGLKAEKERERRMLDYVMSELIWASKNPDVPYSEEERAAREEEEREGHELDLRTLANMRSVMEGVREGKFPEDAEEEEYIELMSYTELLKDSEFDKLVYSIGADPRMVFLSFYASWLDYIKERQAEESMVVRSLLIAPKRKPFPFDALLSLEGLIKSAYADSFKEVQTVRTKTDPNSGETIVLYEGEWEDDDELEEIAARFIQVYREAKKGGDTLLFDLLDDEDFEY